MHKLTRRAMLLRGGQVAAALTALPLRVGAAEPQCVEDESEALRQGLSYVDPSADPGKTCGSCGFFDNKAKCGYCQIMSGPVSESAHCESWSAKS